MVNRVGVMSRIVTRIVWMNRIHAKIIQNIRELVSNKLV